MSLELFISSVSSHYCYLTLAEIIERDQPFFAVVLTATRNTICERERERRKKTFFFFASKLASDRSDFAFYRTIISRTMWCTFLHRGRRTLKFILKIDTKIETGEKSELLFENLATFFSSLILDISFIFMLEIYISVTWSLIHQRTLIHRFLLYNFISPTLKTKRCLSRNFTHSRTSLERRNHVSLINVAN